MVLGENGEEERGAAGGEVVEGIEGEGTDEEGEEDGWEKGCEEQGD